MVEGVLQVTGKFRDHLRDPRFRCFVLRSMLVAKVEVIGGIARCLQPFKVVELLHDLLNIAADICDFLLHVLQVLMQFPLQFLLCQMPNLQALLSLKSMCQSSQGLLCRDLRHCVHQRVRRDQRAVGHHGLNIVVELCQECVPNLLEVHPLTPAPFLSPSNHLAELFQKRLQLRGLLLLQGVGIQDDGQEHVQRDERHYNAEDPKP
mmetsp:Transcript_21873/g.51254  ORF Transcript_21873/g.51254 Transcript_21873/m.51254 type:complete len:206 (-) Transcript_21873:1519-2136(-)